VQPLDSVHDLKKGIIVPAEIFDATLCDLNWTWHQAARGEFPPPFTSLEEFQLAIICANRLLWCQAFLREPTDADHAAPYSFFDYQLGSLLDEGSVVHQDGAEVGKTREIVALAMYYFCTVRNGSGLVAAPQQTHLDEIIEGMDSQFRWNRDLEALRVKWKKQPHHAFYSAAEFKIDFRPAGFDGEAFRGVHAATFGMFDEAAKAKNKKQWSEFWRSLKPTAVARIYSVPDGDRESEYYKLTMRAQGKSEGEEPKGPGANLRFSLYRWGKEMMPFPFWSPERKRFFIDQYGGEDSPGYRHNVLGEHGDPENTVFPWHQFRLCVRDIPEYRALKILVDTGKGEVIAEGYTCKFLMGDEGPLADKTILLDELFSAGSFFAADSEGESPFRNLIRSFFPAVPGMTRGGADFGFSPDPTEITVWNVIGRRRRLVARLQLKQVTYDQQCQALDAVDDVYACTQWGTDFGNAGSAVAHVLQSDQYEAKGYEHRLRGFMFQSTSENVDEHGEAVTDARTGKPAKITLKELSTDLISKKVQRQEVEYPPDQEIITAYTNHTCRIGERQRVYNKENDHLIDSQRVGELAGVLGVEVEDHFACG
jgi:hypothetical protein